MTDGGGDEFLDEDAPPHPGRRIARNSVAVFLVAFFLVTLLLPYRLAAVVSAAIAGLYAVAHLLPLCGRRESIRHDEDETVH